MSEDAAVRVHSRQLGLDLLRILAVVLVLGRHLIAPPASLPGGVRSFLEIWQRGGWVGVDLFFVLSGFLVSGLLFAEYKAQGRLSIGRFYMRRAWRIYPPFYMLLAMTAILLGATGAPVATRRMLSELVFLQSYVPAQWDHTWSLAVEEHFYLLLPLVLLILLKLNGRSGTPFRWIPALAAGLAVGTIVLRLCNWYYRDTWSYYTHFFASHLRLDSLFFGVAISHAFHFHREKMVEVLTPLRRWLIAGGLLMLVPAFVSQIQEAPYIFTFGFSQFYIGSGMLMVGTFLCSIPRNRIVSLMAALGTCSYSIYLWHLPARNWGIPLVEWALDTRLGYGPRVAVYMLGSLVMGVIMAKLVELPALAIRDRFFPSRGTLFTPSPGS